MKMTLYLSLFLLIPNALEAFEDKAALSREEYAAVTAAKGVGIALGARIAWYFFSQVKESFDYIDSAKEVFFGVGGFAVVSKGSNAIITKYAVQKILAKRHGVSQRIEEASLYYDINIDQYRAILQAAQDKETALLSQAIETIYNERFGSEWKKLLKEGYSAGYQPFLPTLLKADKTMLNKKEKDIRRLIELGAAIHNLYFNTHISCANAAVHQAYMMYALLGFKSEQKN